MIHDLQTEKIKSIVDQSKLFALILDEDFEEYELLAREALKTALESKEASVFLIPENPENFTTKWSTILRPSKNSFFSNSLSLSIPKNQIKIKEISYENNDQFFTLNIESEGDGINFENIIFEQTPTAVNAVFYFGENEPKAQNISFPEKEKIILVTKNNRTITEKTKDILQSIDPNLISFSKIPSILLASFISEKIYLRQQFNKDAKNIEEFFLKSGADKEAVNKIIMNFLSLNELPIL
jgi:hypothetical protein